MRPRSLLTATLLSLGLGAACVAPEAPDTEPAPSSPPAAETCDVPAAPALRLLPSSGSPPLEIERVLVSDLGCRLAAGGRRATLFWEDAWAAGEPLELPGGATGLSSDGSALTGRSRASDGSSMAWWRTEERGRSYLGRLDQEAGAAARAVSGDGLVVVGQSGRSAFRWLAAEGMSALPPLAAGEPVEAVATSEDGSVSVGRGRNAHGNLEAVRWSGTEATALGDLPGGIFASQATAVSPDGTVVVGVSDGATGPTAFAWSAGSGLSPLPCPAGGPPGACNWRPRAVSNSPTVVAGCFEGPNGSEALLWSDDHGAVPVRELIETEAQLDLEGWTLTCATDLGASGRLLAGPGRNAAGVPGAWLVRLP